MNKRDQELFDYIMSHGDNAINIIKGKRTTRSLRYNLVKAKASFIEIFKPSEIDYGMEKVILSNRRFSNLKYLSKLEDETLKYLCNINSSYIIIPNIKSLDSFDEERIIKIINSSKGWYGLENTATRLIQENRLTKRIIEVLLNKDIDTFEVLQDYLTDEEIIRLTTENHSLFVKIKDTSIIPYEVHEEIIREKSSRIKYSSYKNDLNLQKIAITKDSNNINLIESLSPELIEFCLDLGCEFTLCNYMYNKNIIFEKSVIKRILLRQDIIVFFIVRFNEYIKENSDLIDIMIEKNRGVHSELLKYKFELTKEQEEKSIKAFPENIKYVKEPSIELQNLAVELAESESAKLNVLFIIIQYINKDNIKHYSQEVINLLMDLPEACRFTFRKEFKETSKFKIGKINQML